MKRIIRVVILLATCLAFIIVCDKGKPDVINLPDSGWRLWPDTQAVWENVPSKDWGHHI